MTDMKKDRLPEFEAESFHCPHCGAFAAQEWGEVLEDRNIPDNELKVVDGEPSRRDYHSAECFACGQLSLWRDREMVYPLTPSAPAPHKDMPLNVKTIYEEARLVEPFSKRAAAALLRVSLEKLAEELGETKGSLHTRIAQLKKKGLSDEVIEALEIVHITASEGGSHAGVIDLENKDTPDIVNTLFDIVNFIVKEVTADSAERKNLRDYVKKMKEQARANTDNSN